MLGYAALSPNRHCSGLSRRGLIATGLAALVGVGRLHPAIAQSDPLPSWNDGAGKQAITGFVARVTWEGVEFVDDGPGKPVGINRFIGRRPIFAFGNSVGDQQMLSGLALSALGCRTFRR